MRGFFFDTDTKQFVIFLKSIARVYLKTLLSGSSAVMFRQQCAHGLRTGQYALCEG